MRPRPRSVGGMGGLFDGAGCEHVRNCRGGSGSYPWWLLMLHGRAAVAGAFAHVRHRRQRRWHPTAVQGVKRGRVGRRSWSLPFFQAKRAFTQAGIGWSAGGSVSFRPVGAAVAMRSLPAARRRRWGELGR